MTTSTPPQSFNVSPDHAGKTVAACLRLWLPGQTWTQVRKLVETRRVKLNGEIWLDDARRLKAGDTVEILAHADKLPATLIDQIPLRYIDDHVIVVEKPSGISTVRHPAEKDWLEERRMLVLTLDDLVMRQVGMNLPRKKHDSRPRLRIVQRLDKETSGLVVFARTVDAERGLGMQFRRHTVTRRYLAIVAGIVTPQTIRSTLVRDRGDGRRGSTKLKDTGKEAITHVSVEEALPGYTLLSVRLETGRTHQIRIHLSELGHPVCGERVYNRRPDSSVIADESGAPRLALHAAELGFTHPLTEEVMHWEMPPPDDLREFLKRLRGELLTMEIKWHDIDPETGERRYLAAERFANVWKFRFKFKRRGEWTRGLEPTRAMWEHVLDAMERRYWRREGVELEDVAIVKKILAKVIREEERRSQPEA